jgi:hypothetical protein
MFPALIKLKLNTSEWFSMDNLHWSSYGWTFAKLRVLERGDFTESGRNGSVAQRLGEILHFLFGHSSYEHIRRRPR